MQEETKWRILVTDVVWPSIEPEAEVLARVGGELVLAETGREEELLRLVPEADAILTCFAHVPAGVIAAGKKLQVVGRYGIGVDNIAVAEATRRDILVTNVPAYCLDEVSEHAMGLLLACARKICHFDNQVRAGAWGPAGGKPLFRVRGQTLGIVGFGKIGQTLAPKALAFGMRVLVYDPAVEPETVNALQCEQVDLDRLLVEADFVSLHAPLTESTQSLIDEAGLRRMKSTAFLINTARGAIIDQAALVKALEQGCIAGAALDVFVPERIPADHPLLKLPNVIATPHVAFYSEEALLDLEILAAENVAAVLSGRRPASVVNPGLLDSPRWSHLQ
jgi:D-3-phosphoglycerate dehydrogenase